ncbi:hypothetical protein QBC40DRAFT_321469 [Triangularia verruculosa]|uniref:Uncharacterized protein n=1 Tax=Triangularia verruculosa TaxID=2587418 RepID=A0AAN6XLM2_9PEZI|nr:hypothetical protein QBC40DRAFT_321469 [Triangularia verruculosa]
MCRKCRDHTRVKEEPWTSGFQAHFPWVACISIVSSLILTGAMIFITVRADNSNVESWSVPPPVLLAITSTAVNIFVHVALVRGASVAWWYLIMHPARQSRVQDIHWRWAASGGLVDALESIAIRGPSKTAISCSLATIMAVNAPLLQRALSVRTQEHTGPGVHVGPIYAAHRLPLGFGATAGAYGIHFPTPSFSEVTEKYLTRSPIVFVGDVGSLEGAYITKLPAAGYHLNCSAEQSIKLPKIERTDLYSVRPVIFLSSIAYYEFSKKGHIMQRVPTLLKHQTRVVDYDGRDGPRFYIDLIWKPKSGCANTTHETEIQERRCQILPATINYPVLLTQNNTLTLLPSPSAFNDELVSLETPEEAERSTSEGISTHGGLALLLAYHFSANYSLQFLHHSTVSGGEGWTSKVDGYFAYEMATYPSEDICDGVFKDPAPLIYNAIRELSLRSALKAANVSDPSHGQQLEGEEKTTVAVYIAKFGLLYGAVAVTMLATLSVIPLYHGFWKLGREVSMSPLEIAKAFRSRQLDGVPSNSTVQGLLKGAGERPVMYGVVDAVFGDEKEWVFGMGDPNLTVHPDEIGERDSLEWDGEETGRTVSHV